MARRNAFAQKVKGLLTKGLRERIPDKHHFRIHIEPTGYEDDVRAVVISDYFRRKDFFERVDFISDLLREEGLTNYELLKAIKLGLTEREAEKLGL